MKNKGAYFRFHVLQALLAVAILLVGREAFAVGRVEWKTKTIKESDNHAWTIDVSLYLSRAPDVATLPMRFSFQPVAYYERAMVDGHSEPQSRTVPLEGKPPLVESVDVGFLDPGTGKIEKRTKFSFKVTRAHGYEAGEYDVTIKDGRSDATVGTTAHVIFDGQNEVIDRRSIVFTGEKKEKAKDADKSDSTKSDDTPQKKELTPDDPGYWQGGPKDDDSAKNEEVEQKRGCGCRIDGRESNGGFAGLAIGVSLLLARRSRRRHPRAT